MEIKAALQIAKPASEVFPAIVDPAKMSNYFISWGSDKMEEGRSLTWKFPEFDDTVPVNVDKVIQNDLISYYWNGPDGKKLLVEIKLEHRDGNDTLVKITEKSMPNNEAGIKWLMGNTEGWANFLACLKAYLEYGINLRRGGFDFMMKK